VAKVTSKLQVTVPKALADRYGIVPGDDIEWEAAGDAIRVVPAQRAAVRDLQSRARLFDQATKRQLERQRSGAPAGARGDRGWTREELYGRGQPR
jgi:bifunctional DNA-binding transcriptional regulator/antitoxin component of YhaV-PrlF toxin-antitoxin module